MANYFALLSYSNNIRYCCNDFAVVHYNLVLLHYSNNIRTYCLHFLFICNNWVSLHLLVSATSLVYMIASNGRRNINFVHKFCVWKSMTSKIFGMKYFCYNKWWPIFHTNYLELKLTWTKIKQIMVLQPWLSKLAGTRKKC